MVVSRHDPGELHLHADGAVVKPSVPGFAILRELGTGARGTVYAASNGRVRVALKVLRPGLRIDRPVMERFLRTSPERLRHPSLPVLESIEEVDQGFAYSMGLLQGDSLETLLKDLKRGQCADPSLNPLSVGPNGELHPELGRHAAEMIAEVAEGLALVHARGVVHHRLTPRNLIFSPAGHLVVTDFGADRSIADPPASSPDEILYRAPEILSCLSSEAGPEADVYSLGVILYELLARRSPFESEDVHEVERAVRQGHCLALMEATQTSGVPGVTPGLVACVEKAMQVRPESRYQNADALAADLRRFLRDEQPLAYEEELRKLESTASQLTRFDRTFWFRAVAALVFTGLLAFAFLGGAHLGRHSDNADNPDSPGGIGSELGKSAVLLNPGVGSITTDNPEPGIRRPDPTPAAVARKLGIPQPEQEAPPTTEGNLESKTAGLSELDTLQSNIGSPLRSRQAAALEQLRVEIVDAIRPRDDARLAVQCLHTGDSEIRRQAMRVLAGAGQGLALLECFPLGPLEPEFQMESRTLALLRDTLSALPESELWSDGMELLCAWDLDVAKVLDHAPTGSRVIVPPNLFVDVSDAAPRDYVKRWMQIARRIDPDGLLAAAPSLATSRENKSALLGHLVAMGSDRASMVVKRLVLENARTLGYEALDALGQLGSFTSLLELAVGELPLELRSHALEVLAERFPGPHFPELRILALSSPEPALRRSAFLALSTCDSPVAVSIILETVNDYALREDSLKWLRRLSAREAAPVCLELLEHGHDEVRRAAIEILSGHCSPALIPRLSIFLLDRKRRLREGAFEILKAHYEAGCLRQSWNVALQGMTRRIRKLQKPLQRELVPAISMLVQAWDGLQSLSRDLRNRWPDSNKQ